MAITTQITDGVAAGLRANGAYVILHNGTTAGQVSQVGTTSIVGETLTEFPYIAEGGSGGFSLSRVLN
jgi:hypothetical protein